MVSPTSLSAPAQMIGASLTLAWRRFAGGIDLDGLETYFRDDDPAPGEDPARRDVRRPEHPYGETVRVVNRQQVPVPLTSRPVRAFASAARRIFSRNSTRSAASPCG